MPYIPEIHKQYPVLPMCREHGGEVFQYETIDLEEIADLTGEYLVPYGFDSYEAYYSKIDRMIQSYSRDETIVGMLRHLKESIQSHNIKENWSICKYIGSDVGGFSGLHKGGYYYWPCSAENPIFDGVIDDEEFTAYYYPPNPDDWEIIVDPTGMAFSAQLDYRSINDSP